MRDTMLDLETLATQSNAVIVSIGAVNFDEENLEEEGFYAVLDTADQVKHGRVIDASTVSWWSTQSDGARKVLSERQQPVVDVLEQFADFCKERIWGNGADFDNIILGSLYDAYGIKRPWSYSKNRCFRTIKNVMKLTPKETRPEFEGVKHNALADALNQAQHLQVLLKGKIRLS